MPKILRLTRFFWCLTLRTGSFLIGILGWMGSLLFVTLLWVFTGTRILKLDEDEKPYFEDNYSNNIPILLSAFLMSFACVSLIWGTYTNNRQYIVPWLILKFLEYSTLSTATFTLFFGFLIHQDILLLVVLALTTGISTVFWYCWICVWSLYKDLSQ